MADMIKLAERLKKRFKDVPQIEDTDTLEWIETALNEHGYSSDDNVPAKKIPLILLYAEADGAFQIALRTAHYFSFVDKDESVDKSMVSEQYRKLSDDLWKRYRRMKDDGSGGFGGSAFHIATRVDRP